MRVVHVLNSFATGGLEKGVATLAKNTSERMEHIILCLTKSGDSARLLPERAEVLELNKPPGNSLRFLYRLSRVLKDLRPDVVHTRNWGGTEGVIAARIAGIKAVVHGEHGFDIDNPTGRNVRRIWCHRYISRWIREYTCVSKSIKKWFQQVMRVNKRVTQIYNGVDTDLYHPGKKDGLRRGLGISNSTFVVGTVGRLVAIKDYSTLIRSFKILNREVKDSVLLIVGDGPERRNLESQAGDGVIFLGNRLDIPELMRSFDVFALTSINEGISNTILEAMATGLPIVASRVGGNTDLIEEDRTGYLFPTGDVNRLASILLNYAESWDLQVAHGSNGRERAVSQFDIQSMVRRYEEVWTRVAKADTVRG